MQITLFSGDQANTTPAQVLDLPDHHALAGFLASAAAPAPKGSRGYWVGARVTSARSDANCTAIGCLVIDADEFTPTETPDWARLAALGAYVAHSSHSHRTPEVRGAERWRVILALAEPIPDADTYRRVRQALTPKLPPGFRLRAASQPAFLPTTHPAWLAGGAAPLDWRALQLNAPTPTVLVSGPGCGVCTDAQAAAIVDALVLRYPVKGSRHDYRRDVAGACVELGLAPELALRLLLEATRRVNGDVSDCPKVVDDSYSGGKTITGAGTLVHNYEAHDVVRLIEVVTRPAMPLPPATAGQPVAPGEPPRDAIAPLGDWLEYFNQQYCVLTTVGASGKCRIFSWAESDLGRTPVLQGVDDFYRRHAPLVIRAEATPKPISIAKAWFEFSGRAEASSLCFRPDEPDRIVQGRLNTWTGFGVTPALGDWSRTKQYLFEVVADRNPIAHAYILGWMAWVMQHPGDRAEVVLVLRGRKGTGKNTLLDALCRCLGTHALTVSSPKHLTGNFNAHLQACALLFANEAIPPGDRAAEAVLKALVTDPTIAIERKGVDVENCTNTLSICMASNEAWCVPAGLDEWRFAVFDVSSSKIQDHDYFKGIHAELNSGGLEAMLHDLRTLDLGEWHPRRGVPSTGALVEQQVESLRGAERAVYLMLASGIARGVPPDLSCSDAKTGRVFVSTRMLAQDLNDRTITDTALGRALAKIGTSGRVRVVDLVRGYWLLPLEQARGAWDTAVGLKPVWDLDESGQGWTTG